MHLAAVVTGFILIEYFAFVMLVGRARVKSGILAPAMSGDEGLERAIRVQMNTLEQMAVAIPAMWMFCYYISEPIGAALGGAFFVGRALYCRAYLCDPGKRTVGFVLGWLATVVLLLGGLYGAVMAVM